MQLELGRIRSLAKTRRATGSSRQVAEPAIEVRSNCTQLYNNTTPGGGSKRYSIPTHFQKKKIFIDCYAVRLKDIATREFLDIVNNSHHDQC